MSVLATVVLDSGCFLPRKEVDKPYSADIAYFESASTPDIRVRIDGNEITSPDLERLGKNCVLYVRHKDADDKLRKDGVTSSREFHDQLLHLNWLYDADVDIDPAKCDCIIHFDSGLFCPSMVKTRVFKEHKRQANGTLAYSPGDRLKTVRPIAHNVRVHFRLEDGEAMELARDEKPFWSSKDYPATGQLEIEFVSDNSTAEKFYDVAFKDEKSICWLPNQGDPPPSCSKPPCNGTP